MHACAVSVISEAVVVMVAINHTFTSLSLVGCFVNIASITVTATLDHHSAELMFSL